MTKLTLTDLSNLQNENTATATINANNSRTEAFAENSLSRDGSYPNNMNSVLDMNSNQIINLPEPTASSSPVRLEDLLAITTSSGGGNVYAANYLSEYVGHEAAARANLGVTIVSVKDYGVVAGSGSDQSAGFASAVAALPSTGSVLYIPPGNYVGKINLGSIPSVTIWGYGAQIILPNNSAGNAAVITSGDGVTYCPGTRILGLSVNGNKANQTNTTYGIWIRSIESPLIEHCTVQLCKSYGIFCQGTASRNSVYAAIRNCYVTTNDDSGIAFTGQCYGGFVQFNTISGNGSPSNHAWGFFCNANDTHLISNNQFDGGYNACLIQASSTCIVSDNHFINQDYNCISLDAADHTVVVGNMVQSPSGAAPDSAFGIQLSNGSAYNLVNDNIVWGRNQRMGDGIKETSASDNNSIIGNKIINAVSPLSVIGGSTTARLNSGALVTGANPETFTSNSGVGMKIKDSTPQNGNTFIQFLNNATVAGGISSNGTTTMTYGSASDARLKEDYKEPDVRDILDSIKVRDFAWKETGEREIGLIAQEVNEVTKEYKRLSGAAVHTADDRWMVDASKLVPLLIASNQEQEKRIQELEKKLNG